MGGSESPDNAGILNESQRAEGSWALKTIFESGLLFEELALIYQKMEVGYVRLKPDGSPMGQTKSAYNLASDATYTPALGGPWG